MRWIKRIVILLLALLLASIAGPEGSMPAHPTEAVADTTAPASQDARNRRVIVLGFDGLDPVVCRQLMAAGRLPNLRKLSAAGTFQEVQTSMPPLSPVAWSEFTTGADASVHGIFDFLLRDPDTLLPVMSMACAHQACCTLPLGPWQLPLGGSVELLRRGKAFWQVLDEHGIPTTVLACPANYPPPRSGGRSLSGMGTPDMLGSQGRFTAFVELADGESPPPVFRPSATLYPLAGPDISLRNDPQESGEGRVVRFVFGADGIYRDELRGPVMPLRVGEDRSSIPLTIRRDMANRAALIDLDGTRVLLGDGEWTPMWIPVRLPLGMPGATTTGMVRMLLASLSPLRLYVSPINIDPAAPAQTISTPDGYASELAERTGRFYTETIPEDVAALEAGVLNRDEFLQLAHHILQERRRQLEFELSRHHRGLLFVYFGGSDLVQHAFFKEMQQEDMADAPWRDAVADIYSELDAAVGRAQESIANDPDAVLVVLSDHGFSRYRRAFDVNAWLVREEFRPQRVTPENAGQLIAFGMGLNGLYLNLRGREANGVLDPAIAPAVLAHIRTQLLAERDPENGEPIFREVYITRDLYPGIADNPEIDLRAPDLLLGYYRGYRTAGGSSEGQAGEVVVFDNRSHWTGDHCTDFREVPGVLFSNRTFTAGDADLITLRDLAPTLLALFGVDAPAQMTGRVLTR